ncbi:MAG: hypothetical protein WA985_04420 [Erythrobacter sp.]
MRDAVSPVSAAVASDEVDHLLQFLRQPGHHAAHRGGARLKRGVEALAFDPVEGAGHACHRIHHPCPARKPCQFPVGIARFHMGDGAKLAVLQILSDHYRAAFDQPEARRCLAPLLHHLSGREPA